MTRISNDNRPARRRDRAMPHWLVLAISVLALSVPIAGLLFLVWLAIMRPASFDIPPTELAYIALATVLIGIAMAFFIHWGRHSEPQQSGARVTLRKN